MRSPKIVNIKHDKGDEVSKQNVLVAIFWKMSVRRLDLGSFVVYSQ